jgi:hypothetical protein
MDSRAKRIRSASFEGTGFGCSAARFSWAQDDSDTLRTSPQLALANESLVSIPDQLALADCRICGGRSHRSQTSACCRRSWRSRFTLPRAPPIAHKPVLLDRQRHLSRRHRLTRTLPSRPRSPSASTLIRSSSGSRSPLTEVNNIEPERPRPRVEPRPMLASDTTLLARCRLEVVADRVRPEREPV